jgi:hypothetical protein
LDLTLPRFDAALNLRRERLVDFPRVETVETEACA